MSISFSAHPVNNTSKTSLWRNGCNFLVTELNITSTTTRSVAWVQHTNTDAMLATVIAEYMAGFISANADKYSNWDEAEQVAVHTFTHSVMTITQKPFNGNILFFRVMQYFTLKPRVY